MKKAALTFGLFSLVMVATSFANPATTNNDTTINSLYGDGTAGQQGPNTRKLDVYSTGNQSSLNLNQSFGSESQSAGRTIKLD